MAVTLKHSKRSTLNGQEISIYCPRLAGSPDGADVPAYSVRSGSNNIQAAAELGGKCLSARKLTDTSKVIAALDEATFVEVT